MSWTIEFSETSLRSLRKLDRQTSRRITAYLRDIAALEDPRARGKALTGPLVGLWRYRVGDYRIICDIHDAQLTIYTIDIDHRSTAYRSSR